MVEKLTIICFVLIFGLAGCVTVPQREHFDQANFDTMNNIAILVRNLKYNATASVMPGAPLKPYNTPVVYYDVGHSNSSAPSGSVPLGSGWFLGFGVSFTIYPSILIDQVQTNKLQSSIKDYDMRSSLLSWFKEEFIKIRNVNILSAEAVEKLYKSHFESTLDKITFDTKDEFQTEFGNFKNDLLKTLGADTLILIDTGLWGFHRKPFCRIATTKGNFMIIVNFKIIRLKDGKDLFDSYYSVDFSDSRFGKKNSNLEEFLKGEKPIFSRTLQELVETLVSQVLGELKS